MYLGGACELNFPRKAKGGKRTLRTSGMRSLQAGNENSNWPEGGLPREDFRLAMMDAWNKGGEDSVSVSSLSCESTTAPGTPPSGLPGTPPGLPGTPPGLFSPPGLKLEIEERIAKMMEELALKTQTLHATEMRARAAEQKWLELQMQVMLNNMNTQEETLAAQRAMQQLQGCGMPPKIGYPQPAATVWDASTFTGQEAYPTMSPTQSKPLPVGLVMPQAPEVQAPKPVRSKKKAMASQSPAAAAGAGAGLLSRGSKNHALSRCRPCQFVFTPQGCPDGALCNFCHYPHSQAKLLEAAMYSAKAAEKRTGQKKLPKSMQADAVSEATPPSADAVPLSRLGMFNEVDSITSTTPPESQADEELWSVTVEL
mmetsp:Transcript_116072/g.211160  ORF Transcript_116072/g.211160 Transcript_116072/m.211160 type:complete len:369 (-) Transcript_116072:90-1196(-)